MDKPTVTSNIHYLNWKNRAASVQRGSSGTRVNTPHMLKYNISIYIEAYQQRPGPGSSGAGNSRYDSHDRESITTQEKHKPCY